MLQALRRPESAGVCEEVERSSKCLVEASQRAAAIGDFLADLDLSLFEPADSVLVGRDDRGQLRLRDPVEEALDVALDLSLRNAPLSTHDVDKSISCLEAIRSHVEHERVFVIDHDLSI